jgi:uncharacterized membrane protein
MQMEMRYDDNIKFSEDRTLKDLTPNVAALLCYVAGWVSGIVFLVIEQRNRFIRFHALQSIIVFGSLTLAGAVLGAIPFVGGGLQWVIWVTGFILWIILMVKAVSGEVFKIPWAGNLAERLTRDSMRPYASQPTKPEGPAVGAASSAEPVTPVTPAAPAPSVTRPNKADEFRARYYSLSARSGRMVGSSFAIAWSVVLLIFFNFYNQYIAYYEPAQSGSVTTWQMHTLITPGFDMWLPILTTTLVLSIIGHAILMVYDKYALRQIVEIVLGVFGVITVVTLLALYPFDFTPIPDPDVVTGINIGLPISLILIAVGTGIGTLVRFIQFIVNVAEGKT